VVHRLLGALLGLAPLPDAVRDRDALRGCADNLNVRHRNAQMAGRASVELHTLIFFRGRDVVADARVTKVGRGGFDLIPITPHHAITRSERDWPTRAVCSASPQTKRRLRAVGHPLTALAA
jgi:exosome complex exonuclease DIS3/RRP44